MPPEEIKEWDDALLDLINKGLIEIVIQESEEIGFQLCEDLPCDVNMV